MNRAEEIFKNTYKRECDFLSFTPYRICPLGAHIDHQKGIVTGFAINKGIYFAYSKKGNGIIEIQSAQFEKRAQWTIEHIPPYKENDWADYLRGATIALKRRYAISYGLCGVFYGELPIGGLSSSAAITLSFLKALCEINNLQLSNKELIDVSREAENEYVGVACGTLDQSCEVLAKKDKLLYLDTQNGSYELIEPRKNMKSFKIAVIFSGIERNLSSSNYNMRADECKAAAYALKDFSDFQHGKFIETVLRDVPVDIFEKYKDKLPLHWRKRAEHFYSEMKRVELGKKYWLDGNIKAFGQLMFESGKSSINNYEVGSEQLTKLFEIIKKQNGVYGARFSGAGFKGYCLALVDPNYTSSIKENIEKEYIESFPDLKGKYAFYECESADGIGE